MDADLDGLIERLRDRAYSFKAPDELSADAADTIERLAQELARLRDKHERLRGICGETAAGISL